MVNVPASTSWLKVATAVPSCGATGAPQLSVPPCQASTHVSVPISLENEPSRPNTKLSSNQQARASTTAASVVNHSMLPAVGPTPAAPAPSSFQVPTNGETGFLAKLNVHQTPGAVSTVTVKFIPSAVSVNML